MPDTQPQIDVTVTNHGSLIGFLPHTEEAKDWIEANVAAESHNYFGKQLMVEIQYAEDIRAGMADAGLVLE